MDEKNITPPIQNIDKLWDLVEFFFETKVAFLVVYNKYETEVLKHAKEKRVDRKILRLDREEVSKLIDLSKLVKLRNDYLLPLKELSHQMFRRSDSTDPFDRWVNSIFHEISILKEEHYRVKKIAAEYEVVNERDESLLILDEVHEAFPRITNHVYNLFEKATQRLEKLLPNFNKFKVLIRSVNLHGEQILSQVYDKGLESFYEKMYPQFGAFDGYVTVAQSFVDSGFLQQAREALSKAETFLTKYKGTTSLYYQELVAQFTKLQNQCDQLKYSALSEG